MRFYNDRQSDPLPPGCRQDRGSITQTLGDIKNLDDPAIGTILSFIYSPAKRSPSLPPGLSAW
jgi:hypothetical protein